MAHVNSPTLAKAARSGLNVRLQYGLFIFLLGGILTLIPGMVAAQTTAGAWTGTVQNLSVPLYKSRIVQLPGPVAKVSVGNEEVADILVMRRQQIYVLGKGIGTTNVLLWDQNDNLTHSLDIEVTPDINSLKAKLFELAPNENIEVHSSQGAIVLRGEVSNIGTMDTALRLADSFLQKPAEEGATQTGEIINLMKIGGSQQVMLKVTVAEMSRTVLRRMGIKFNALDINDGHWTVGGVSGGARFPDFINEDELRTVLGRSGLDPIAGTAISEFVPSDFSIVDKGLFASYLDSNLLFRIAFDAAKENGQAKILAEPTLTTLSGQEAQFLSGGEFPIPVPQEDAITIEFKEFGIGLRFLPVVLDSGKINLKLNVEVSDLTSLGSVAAGAPGVSSEIFVPALTKRSARSTVEVGDGQSIGIAGLINENMRDVVNKFPGLGDVPILGHLFRSQEFEKGETELVILVTPTLAKPFIADQMSLPGDGFIEPTDVEFYLLGRTHSQRGPRMTATSGETGGIAQPDENGVTVYATGGGSESTFGHSVN